ncbi:MAG: hypothetical protein M1826_004760 [Phylliscum demangeonii]|nr:MAG: hypothetical protein M1826_004760 [Phylliscum demangeonii]
MASMKSVLLVGACAFLSTVAAHGSLQKLKTTEREYNYISGKPPNPEGVGWYSNGDGNIWVDNTMYTSPDIVCGRDYVPGALHANVTAGQDVTLEWYAWGPNHRGAILDYMANCHGPCDQVADKTTLKWFKIQELGLLTPRVSPNPSIAEIPAWGRWATDQMCDSALKVTDEPGSPPDRKLANNPSWTIKIPAGLADGYYTLRTEILALYVDPAVNQHYPRCVALRLSGGGTEDPPGVVGTELYNMNQPGLALRNNDGLYNYTLPGPPLYQPGQQSGSSSQPAAAAAAASAPSASPAAPALALAPAMSSSSTDPAAVPATTPAAAAQPSGASSPASSPAASSASAAASAVDAAAGTASDSAKAAYNAPAANPPASAAAAASDSAGSCEALSTTTVVEMVTVTAPPSQATADAVVVASADQQPQPQQQQQQSQSSPPPPYQKSAATGSRSHRPHRQNMHHKSEASGAKASPASAPAPPARQYAAAPY